MVEFILLQILKKKNQANRSINPDINDVHTYVENKKTYRPNWEPSSFLESQLNIQSRISIN